MGPRSVVLGGGDARGTRHWGLRWTSLYGATKRCTGWGRRMWYTPLGPWVDPPTPYGATKRCTGWGRRMWSTPLGP
eukprot:7442340-Pyramimonas_sp.AAC.1